MWVLLVWCNENIKNAYKSCKKWQENQKRKQALYQQMNISRRIPEYLRRDMGLPSYDIKSEKKNR